MSDSADVIRELWGRLATYELHLNLDSLPRPGNGNRRDPV